jgi:hypothetical protein
MDVIYGGLGVSKLKLLIKKDQVFFSCKFFHLATKTLDPDPQDRNGNQPKMLDPDPESLNPDSKH